MNVICVYKLPIPTYVILRNSTTSTGAVNGTINYQLFLRTQAMVKEQFLLERDQSFIFCFMQDQFLDVVPK